MAVPPARAPGSCCFFAAGSAKRRMDSSGGRSKVVVSSKVRIAHQARQQRLLLQPGSAGSPGPHVPEHHGRLAPLAAAEQHPDLPLLSRTSRLPEHNFGVSVSDILSPSLPLSLFAFLRARRLSPQALDPGRGHDNHPARACRIETTRIYNLNVLYDIR